jgi:succinyl-diaminopimelate desuccinylase
LTATRFSEERLREVVELSRDLILIPSASDRRDEIDRCIHFVADYLSLPGIRVTRHRSRESPSLVALPEGVERPEILFTGHIDVVKISETDDYRARIEDGRICGPGAADMKGAIALMLEVFKSAHRRTPGLPVGIAITSDEETGGADGIGYLFRDQGLRAGSVILPDSGTLNAIAVAEKGILHLRVQVTGAAGHAARPWLVSNALETALASIARVKTTFAQFATDDHWHPTCTVTDVGTPHPANNCIPARAHAVLDIRYTARESEAEMLSMVRAAFPDKSEIEILLASPPTQLQPDPLFVSVTESVTGNPVRLIHEHGGSDARYICEYGIPVIMSRPAIGNMHSVHEWVDIASLGTLGAIYDEYVRRKLASR